MKTNRRWFLQSVIRFSGVFVLVGLISSMLFQNHLLRCANSLSCKDEVAFKVENGAEGIFNNQKVAVPPINPSLETQTAILGTEVSDADKHIYVNLATQILSAYEGDQLFMETPISSGLWGKTPTGDFKIWVKLRSTRMSGGSGADYYNLPNVPYVMFFSNSEVAAGRGFSLHGTYWHNNFGHPMSHGCVNMKTTDAKKLYDWVNPPTDGNITYSEKEAGTVVTIYDGS